MKPQAYVRTKPHLNIATLGPAGHGKTTLTAAVARLLGAAPPAGPAALRTEYETGTRHYAHADVPGAARQLPALDGAVLVVAATGGVPPGTAEHLLLAHAAGARHLVVALTRADEAGPGRVRTAEQDVRRLLAAHGFDAVRTPVVQVSPHAVASVQALLDAVDTCVPTPVRYTQAPFLLAVEDAADGTVTGVLERGTLRPGDRAALTPSGRTATVTAVRTFGKTLEAAQAGDVVTATLGGPAAAGLRRGDVLAVPGSIVLARGFTARVHLPAPPRGPLRLQLRTAMVPGTLTPGDAGTATVALGRPLPVEEGMAFAVRGEAGVLGHGTVTSVP
ncbi:elongation factor Tu-3 [Streptomyces mashuensis]|uniref:Elongation factor Tu-3 n=1 Tax=Streptomyces mashuensis TaxID=33904 RepID=A0A919EB17_9ACTN|nr:GTP-binding protein [Streptomyces mashuensis]GHF30128.1 elongation factor Tu-3 [Streptomyces mashuensis]